MEALGIRNWVPGVGRRRGWPDSGESAAALGRGNVGGRPLARPDPIWWLGVGGSHAGEVSRRRAAAVPAAAGSPVRRREVQGNAQDLELLWDLDEVLGRPSGRRVERQRSSPGRRAWRSGGGALPAGRGRRPLK
jgi:hypothetical protein